MVSCCSMGVMNDFKVIVIGASPLGISITLHAISYGAFTSLIDPNDTDQRIQQFLNSFQNRVEVEQGMVSSMEELEEDMHLYRFIDQPVFKDEHTLFLDSHGEIKGKHIVNCINSSDEKSQEEIWNIGAKIGKTVALNT
jgi:hypothetical protein